MIGKKEFMKMGFDRSFVFRDAQGRMLSNTEKNIKSKEISNNKKTLTKASKKAISATSKMPIKKSTSKIAIKAKVKTLNKMSASRKGSIKKNTRK